MLGLPLLHHLLVTHVFTISSTLYPQQILEGGKLLLSYDLEHAIPSTRLFSVLSDLISS